MIYENNSFSRKLVYGLKNYKNYFLKNKLNIPLKIKINLEKLNFRKYNPSAFDFVKKYNKTPLSPELDDLCRLHYLVRNRKVTTILEFGVGKSTLVFDDALKKNYREFEKFIVKEKMIRRSNKFECHTIDDQAKWINNIKKNYRTSNVIFHKTNVKMTTFADRRCTLYDKLPKISPDFIYLDGPARFSAKGNVKGWTTNFSDGVPMAADILSIEHFLMPGTLIVVDGRAANSRFLKSNLQRDWIYAHDEKFDQHFFELSEKPLGVYNKRQIEFCLGKKYFYRVKNKFK